jgi:hypothetical protein
VERSGVSGRPALRLRAAPPPAVDPRSAEDPLRLVSALSAPGRLARSERLGAGPDRPHELCLPGIGGRYLAGLAAAAHRRGWAPAEVTALLDAVESRAAMWIVSPSATPLRHAGLLPGRRGRGRTCVRWTAGRWARVAVDVDALAAVAAAGAARGLALAAVSGAGAPERLAAALAAAEGVRMGRLAGGLAAAIGVPWTVELVVAPALPAVAMMSLRERIAQAPRCGWCGVPILGADCRRCLTEPRR